MSVEENKALLRRWVDEVLNGGNMAAVDEFLAPDLVNHSARQGKGRDGIRDIMALIRAAFPDVTYTVDDLIAEGDLVVVRFTVRGTHTNLVLLDAPPTGKAVTWTGIAVYRIAGGKVVETWGDWDDLGLFQQLGVIPEPTG